MRISLKSVVALSITFGMWVVAGGFGGTAAAETGGSKYCAVSQGRQFETATPEEVGLDSVTLGRAVAAASSPNRLNFKVFRNNCLIASGPRNGLTGAVPWNLWSATKSVVSLVAGIAVDEGLLRLDSPINNYLPLGLGDAEHRAIRVRNLLTESSGIDVAVVSEGVTGLVELDPNVVAQALAMPIEYPQGTKWQYSQRAVDLIAYVVQQAVGEDFQAYAQRKLFDPLGIRSTDYYWARDRSGNTYGYAHLVMAPDDFAKLGLLVANRGNWGSTRIVSEDYLAQASEPSPSHECYGFLFVVNGPGCAAEFPALPTDAVKMSGMMRQDNYIVPSLNLLVSWTGLTVPGEAGFAYGVLRDVAGAFREPPLPDPGPYVPLPDVSITDPMMTNPDATLAALGLGPYAYPGCDPVTCLGKPLPPPFADWPVGCFIVGCFTDTPGRR
ncbi:CubicO group peptidase, beta-lactamase class C family [Nocardia amikacinitolerans]|nr:CubicO group peptidase, beta-lactamase class C family [Nocardia amikacinitolerans]